MAQLRHCLEISGTYRAISPPGAGRWKWGKTDLNILMVAVLIGPLAFPLLWEVLPHGGSSSQKDRQTLLERLFDIVPFQRFVGVIADREFLGQSWFGWLRQ